MEAGVGAFDAVGKRLRDNWSVRQLGLLGAGGVARGGLGGFDRGEKGAGDGCREWGAREGVSAEPMRG